MKFPILYKKSKKAVLQQWQIFIYGNTYYTEAGQVGGAITRSLPTEVFGKNTEKANATTDEEQTLKEVLAIITKQKEKGYNEEIKDAGKVDYFKPMLAKEYDKYKDKLVFPVYSQPKLDGVRCIASKDGLFSRSGKPIVACPHVFESIKHLFEGNPSLILDGELYSHTLKDDFDSLISLIRRTKPDENDLVESEKSVQYWVYDTYDSTPFAERFSSIKYLSSLKYIVIVPTTQCVSQKDLDKKYEEYLEDGFEGQMVRVSSAYENCRTQALLKRKEFIEEEFPIKSIIEGTGNWAKAAGAIVLELNGGRTFKATPKVTFETKQWMWTNQNDIVGKRGTVRFQSYTPDMVPRFPRFIAVRDYE